MGLRFKTHIYHAVSLAFNHQIFQAAQHEVSFIPTGGIGGHVDRDSATAGRQSGEEPRRRIFHHRALPGRQTQPLGAQQIGVRRRFAVLHLLGGDEHLRHRQARRAVTRVRNRNRAGGDNRPRDPSLIERIQQG